MMAFDLGDIVPLSFQIRDSSGTLANATTVTLTITQPDQTVTGPYTLTSTSAGVYDYDFEPTLVGRHLVRCVATGSNASAFTDAFDVTPANPAYLISLDEAKAHLRITMATDDDALRLYLVAVTGVIEQHIQAPVVPRSFTEIMAATDTIVLSKAPVITLDSVTQAFPYYSGYYGVPDYLLDGPSGLLRAQPYWPGTSYRWVDPGVRLTITYTAGRTVIPAAMQLAARIIVEELWSSRRAATPIPARGQDSNQIPVPGGYGMPDTAVELLRPFTRGSRVG